MKKDLFKFLTGALTLIGLSCDSFVSIPPPKTQLAAESVFSDTKSATSALTGIYSRMSAESGFASGGMYGLGTLLGYASDEFISYSINEPFFSNTLTSDNVLVEYFLWNEPYRYIYTANAVVEGMAASHNIGNASELTGEALFVRAFCYFYLTSLFGDVPLHLTTDYRINSQATRTPVHEVFEQIIEDLEKSRQLMPENASQNERTRPDKWAATALLSRVFLYTRQWEKAETLASSLIALADYRLEDSVSAVFLKSSAEVIWQLKPVLPGINTNEGAFFILTAPPINTSAPSLSNPLINAFEKDDRRKSWIGNYNDGQQSYPYPFKYRIKSGDSNRQEYSIVMRLAEQYLILSEALAMQNKIPEAIAVLDKIRTRSNLPSLSDNNQEWNQKTLLLAIEKERQCELFSEWGHRWFDLIRTERAGKILPDLKPGYTQTSHLLPIPDSERNRNINLSQNEGY